MWAEGEEAKVREREELVEDLSQAIQSHGVRPRVLPMAGLLFQAAILGFPLFAGWVIADLGYAALFAVLVSLALAQAVIGWWRYSATRSATFLAGPR